MINFLMHVYMEIWQLFAFRYLLPHFETNLPEPACARKLQCSFKDNRNSLGIFVPGANTPNFFLSSLTKIIVLSKQGLKW